MSDYQVTNYGMCGECKHYYPADTKGNWCCCNEDSEYFTDYTDYTDTCPMFQERGVDK